MFLKSELFPESLAIKRKSHKELAKKLDLTEDDIKKIWIKAGWKTIRLCRSKSQAGPEKISVWGDVITRSDKNECQLPLLSVWRKDSPFNRLCPRYYCRRIEEKKDGTYSDTSNIGIAGLENVYEDKLRGTTGWKIYVPQTGEVIAEKKAKDGEDLHLTIDINTQTKLYDELKDDSGTAVAPHRRQAKHSLLSARLLTIQTDLFSAGVIRNGKN